jgi:hypothetical protein
MSSRQRGPVHQLLLGPQPVDVEQQRERLGLNLTRCGMRFIATVRTLKRPSRKRNAGCYARRIWSVEE